MTYCVSTLCKTLSFSISRFYLTPARLDARGDGLVQQGGQQQLVCRSTFQAYDVILHIFGSFSGRKLKQFIQLRVFETIFSFAFLVKLFKRVPCIFIFFGKK